MTTRRQEPIGSVFTAASTAEEVLAGVDLTGRTALVTGGYSGLGLETTRALSAAGARVLVPARRPQLALERIADLPQCSVLPMDLGDIDDVRRAGEALRDNVDQLDIVIAAAGVMASPERRIGLGWESHFAINHLGHFVLIDLLYRQLVNAGGARVVVYSSAGHHLSDIRWNDPQFGTGYDKWLAYGQSKTANALFALHLDEIGRSRGVRAFSLHPGSIITDLQRDMTSAEQIDRGWIDGEGTVIGAGFKTPAQGAATGVWLATSPRLDDIGGLYGEDCDIAPIAPPDGSMDDGGVREYACDASSAERLWRTSARLTGVAAARNA